MPGCAALTRTRGAETVEVAAASIINSWVISWLVDELMLFRGVETTGKLDVWGPKYHEFRW